VKVSSKFYHELSEAEINEIINCKLTYKELSSIVGAPEWCGHPTALDGLNGCWHLGGSNRKKITKNFCENCKYKIN